METDVKNAETEPVTEAKPIPSFLIYEMTEEGPIYYRDYRDYLAGTKQLEEIMGSSILQSILVSDLTILLSKLLGNDYKVLTNELGLKFSKQSKRSADIAIYPKAVIGEMTLNNRYAEVAPHIVIEVDTKACFEGFTTELDYYYRKTDDLLNFGVNKVIWVFTGAKKVLIATKGNSW